MPFPGVHVGGQLSWAGNNHVLVGGQALFDLERQIRLWDYQGGEAVTSVGGLTWFVAGEGELHGRRSLPQNFRKTQC